MTDESAEPGATRTRVSAWLVVSAVGDLNGITFDRQQADNRARMGHGVVAELVVVSDFRGKTP